MKLEELKNVARDNFCDTRKEFTETWLSEMPGMAGNLDLYPSLLHQLNDFLKHGFEKAKVADNIFKLAFDDVGYYWVEVADEPVLIVEVKIKPDAYHISMTGKKSDTFGKPPYASDLYSAILKDSKKSLLFSDEYLSDKSFDLWAKLLKSGKQISVYDTKEMELKNISTVDELKRYYHSNGNRFRFTLSENVIKESAIKVKFNLYRTRRENNIL